MDEVDFENLEDLNELEARLYAQIHHEETAHQVTGVATTRNNGDNSSALATNRALSKRYWTGGGITGSTNISHQQQIMQTTQQNTMPTDNARIQKEIQSPQTTDRRDTTLPQDTTSSSTMPANVQHINKGRNNFQVKSTPISQLPGNKSALKVNPFVDRMKQNKNNVANKSTNKEPQISATNPKQHGPFFKQQQKLEKAKRIESKKQKSKKATAKAKKQISTDVIDLLSSGESDCSDVVIIPVPAPPTFTVDDSDDDVKPTDEITASTILVQEENAIDSTDVQMSTSSSFLKPQQQMSQAHTTSECAEKRLDNSSRCTSPCSIQSSDDFIGQVDRSRLLESASGMADDEDLLLLTSDMNSLLEAPKSVEHVSQSQQTKDQPNCSSENITNVSSEFATPKMSTNLRKDYRVDQTQFRALDVYESESDITDSVYSKGTPKATVIREIDVSSDEVEDITCVNIRTKRLRKRRASSSNKGSDVNYENTNSSSEDKSDTDDGQYECERTGIPFISRGPAVERKMRKRSRTLSTNSPATACGKSFRSKMSMVNMSDGDFITKLNNLVQGQDEENEPEDSDDDQNAPSAREIAEKILTENTSTISNDTAVPKDVCNRVTEVLHTIDDMEESEKDATARENEQADTTTSSSERQKAIVYKSIPNEDMAQIITYVADSSPSTSNKNPVRKRASNGSPIYNLVYDRGVRKLSGGIGWSNEMRKFYEESWNGENFILDSVWEKMSPEKHLWRIYTEDRFSKSNKRHNNLKCTNCCDFGHSRAQCKRPRKPLICYMCGESGHQEPRCPNTMCLRCGNKTQVFIKACNACSFQNRLLCPICKIRGHSIDFCPDKWRRYHSTTEPNAFPNSNIVYNTRKYCSICGHRGHLADMCRSAVHFMEYPVIATAVKSHQKSYNDMAVKSTFGGIGYNLMYEPCLEYSFSMAERTTVDKYYGRFLCAVGMEYALTRKRPLNVETGSTTKKLKRSKENKEPRKNETAPNQVQEISESGVESVDNECSIGTHITNDSTPNEGEVESTVHDDGDIQLNILNPTTSASIDLSKFKSPHTVTSTNNPPQIMDSDSNYSFSEHFDVPSPSINSPNKALEMQHENTNESPTTLQLPGVKERPKPREMETLPDFIPLVNSNENCDDTIAENTVSVQNGISNRFIVAESDDENYDERGRKICQTSDLPCEAKIYLNNFHSKYLISADGRNFLAKSSKACELKARLDFTSVGHVLVIFGLPNNQEKFQRELLMKYREISDQENQKNIQSTINVPKRTDVLIRFLRDDINQLLSNLGNVNHLYRRLQYVERQQSKSGFKMADKIRRSLNMILVGQAGLQDGNIHLDKLLFSLKTLINDYNSEDVTPLQLRTEISGHWKFIFSSYRHDNYQDLIQTYNKLISKNQMPKLSIDPLLLGNKILDTSLTSEQKEKLEQPKQQSENFNNRNPEKRPSVSNPVTPKNSKLNKRKQSSLGNNNPTTTLTSPAKTPSAQSIRQDVNVSTPVKIKSTAANSTTPVSVSKKQHKSMPPPPFANPERRSVVSTDIQQVTNKWKNKCDTLLTEISAKPTPQKGNNINDSKIPSTFWSRESIRYIDECISIVSSRPELMEKLKRVQHKSRNGQLSYNDYLAVIKLHTALTGK